MRCAVSFLTVIVLSSAVGVTALLIIYFTGSEDYCGGGASTPDGFRCLKNGKCLKPSEACNNVSNCPDGEDEDPMYCNDLTTLYQTIDILTRHGKTKDKNNTEDLDDEMDKWEEEMSRLGVDEKPEICEYSRWYDSDLPIGIKCHGKSMNGTFDSIPWDEFDRLSRTISVDFGALNTTVQTAHVGNTSLHFPLLDKLYIEHNYIESVGDHAFCNLQTVRWFSMVNNHLSKLSPDAFCPMEKLDWIKLSQNKLNLTGFHFKNMPRLSIIDLDQNEIEEITDLVFSELPNLQNLNLSHNRISFIHENAFSKNINLTDLDLSNNQLHKVSANLFHSQSVLKKLYITRNPKLYLPYFLFKSLSNLRSLNIDTLDISQLNVESFKFTPYLDLVFFKKFSYCRYVPKARRCYPYSDGLVTIVGNLSVLANRWALRKRPAGRTQITEILNIFVTNLAIADLLMGVYLIVLACKDVEFRGVYSVKAYEWGTSVLCSLIGILALISSEVSLLILTIMSLERFLTIGGPFSERQNLNANLTRASMGIIWVFACILAIAPAITWQVTGNTAFYGSTGLCFPIHLDERYPIGWQYTTFVFIGVNSCCLVLITASYSLLFYTVKKTQGRTPVIVRNIELASRVFLMVLTDVLCWAPIIILKGSVLCGVELEKETIAWAVIYILPLNSAVNPILYTFSTNEVRLAMTAYFRTFLENLELNRMIPSQNHGNSIELQCMTRSLFGGSRSGTKRKDQELPNTAGTEDTELTHSVCPTVSGRESRSWYST